MFYEVVYLIVVLISGVKGYDEVEGTWLSSAYFRAGNENVINHLTGAGEEVTYTFLFSSALSAVPNLAYGLKNYIGNDYLGNQWFEIRRKDLTEATFTVSVEIFKVTNIQILNVPYIAIDPSFPHHINTFNDVPINYNAGPLTNITTRSTTQTQIYMNTINYTLQNSPSSNYKTFPEPLSKCKVIFFMSALEIYSTLEDEQPYYPIHLQVQGQIISTTEYTVRVSVRNRTLLSGMRLSQVMVDVEDVQASNKYYVTGTEWQVAGQGGFMPLPEPLVDNFIMGLLGFSTDRGRSVLHFNWEYATEDGVHGVKVLESQPLPALLPFGLTTMTISTFYIKTWQCPSTHPYFNLTTDKCQDTCPTSYYGLLAQTYQCLPCPYHCLTCTQGQCLTCVSSHHRQVINGVSCECIYGYYEQGEQQCGSCEELFANCGRCFIGGIDIVGIDEGCTQCVSGYILYNATLCVACQYGTYANKDTNQCDECTIEGCMDCSAHDVCSVCGTGYFLNSNTLLCEKCEIEGCDRCASESVCSLCLGSFTFVDGECVCTDGTYLDSNIGLCLSCSPVCRTCVGSTSMQCGSCWYEHHRMLIGTYCICESNYQEGSGAACQKIDPSICDNGEVLVQNSCIQICGDGILLHGYQCDDGNSISGDGCSSSCTIQPYFICTQNYHQQSICSLNTTITIIQASVQKSYYENTILIKLTIEPTTQAFNEYLLAYMVGFQSDEIIISRSYQSDGMIYIEGSYKQDIDDKNVHIRSENNKVGFAIAGVVKMHADNNLRLHYYQESTYQRVKLLDDVCWGMALAGGVLAIICLFVRNSFSAFFVITNMQILYISVSLIDGMDPWASTLVHFHPIMGYNIPLHSTLLEHGSINEIGFDTTFTNNLNIMLLLCIIVWVLCGIVYLLVELQIADRGVYKLFHHWFLLCVLFNMCNLVYSLALFRVFTPLNITVSAISSFLFIYQLVHFYYNYQTYYGVNIFNDKKCVKIWFYFYVSSKVIICLAIGLILLSHNSPALVTIIVQFVAIVVFLFIRPYLHAFDNAVMVLAEVFLLVGLLVIYAIGNWVKQSEGVVGWTLLLCNGCLILMGVTALLHGIIHNCPKKTHPLPQPKAQQRTTNPSRERKLSKSTQNSDNSLSQIIANPAQPHGLKIVMHAVK